MQPKHSGDTVRAFVLQGLRIVDVSDEFCRLTGYGRDRCLEPGFVYDLCAGTEWQYLRQPGRKTLMIRLANGETRMLDLVVDADDDRRIVEMRSAG